MIVEVLFFVFGFVSSEFLCKDSFNAGNDGVEFEDKCVGRVSFAGQYAISYMDNDAAVIPAGFHSCCGLHHAGCLAKVYALRSIKVLY